MDAASDPSLSIDQIFQRLSANETAAPFPPFPNYWEGQMLALLPARAGWIGLNGKGGVAMWRTSEAATVTLNFETLRGIQAAPFNANRFGVVVRDSQLHVAMLEPKQASPGHLPGSTLRIIKLSDGAIDAQRDLESEARLVVSPSGRRLLFLLPVAPLQSRIISETSGAPPPDDQARRTAKSAVRLVSAEAIDQEQPFTAHIGVGCYDAGFSVQESVVWTRDPNGYIRVFRATDQRRIGPVFRSPKEATIAATDDGRLLISLFGELRVYDVATGRLVAKQATAHARPIVALAVRPNGDSVATYGRDGTVRAWNLADMALIGEWDAPETDDGGGYLCFVDNDTLAAAARRFGSGSAGPTSVLSWKDRTQFGRWNTAASGAIFHLVAVSPQGTCVVVADSAQNIGFYDNAVGTLMAFRRAPIREVFSLYAPEEKPLAITGPYEGSSGYVAADDGLITTALPQLASIPLKRWSSVTMETSTGRFVSTDYLDWIGTFGGQGVRAGQAGFPRAMGQPQGWVAIPGSDVFAAIGWYTIVLYAPKEQRVVHAYRLLSRAVHAAYDPMSHTLVVVHGDGVLRHWPLPITAFQRSSK